MNKFETMLAASATSIQAQRAKDLAEDCKIAQEEIVRASEKEVRDIKRKITQLSDLSPDTTLSLEVVKKGFNPTSWAEELHQLEVDLLAAEVELKVAKKTFATWFAEPKDKASKEDKTPKAE